MPIFAPSRAAAAATGCLLASWLVCTGCASRDAKAAQHPSKQTSAGPIEPLRVSKLPDGFQPLSPGVGFREDTLQTGRVWLYVPDETPPVAGWPLMIIAPAGSSLLTGMRLSPDDRPEHLPYVEAGYAVVSYDIAGALAEDADNEAFASAVAAFFESAMGVLNGAAALQHVLRVLPVDETRVYSAGHSSAGTLALQLGAAEPRIDGVIAYAPVADLEAFLRARVPELFSAAELGEVLHSISPMTLASELNKPVFLFHARTDSVVPVNESRALAERLRTAAAQVSYVEPEKGDHYQSMIHEGIPQALRWLAAVNSTSR